MAARKPTSALAPLLALLLLLAATATPTCHAARLLRQSSVIVPNNQHFQGQSETSVGDAVSEQDESRPR